MRTTVTPTQDRSAAPPEMHAYAFVANTLLPAQPAQGGFEEAPSERSAEIAHPDTL